MNNAWHLLRAQDTVVPTTFPVLFSTVGGRYGKEGVKGAAAARPAEFREVPRPPPAKGAARQGRSSPNLEAVQES